MEISTSNFTIEELLQLLVVANKYNFTPEELQEYLECEGHILLKSPLYKAISILQKELEDPEYFYSWQSNIAMQFKDLFEYSYLEMPHIDAIPYTIATKDKIHDIANKAAINFLTLLMK